MEDTLRVEKKSIIEQLIKSLNPCFNGRYSQSAAIPMIAAAIGGLNPCFNGRYSQRV